jgi:hypothetical protein
MRFQIIMYLAQEELGKMCPDLKAERFWKIVHTAEASADQGIQLIGGKRLMPEDIIGIHDPRAISHRDTLLDHMHNTLAAELEPLSYVPLKI